MASSFYEKQLTILAFCCFLGFLLDKFVSSKRTRIQTAADPEGFEHGTKQAEPKNYLWRQYLVVYAIVMGADWLQGPYVYSLYREQYKYSERTVAALFVTGFICAGLTAPLIGVWADQHGRKKLCLTFCLTYTTACLLILVPSLPTLFLGRVLGGISTSILFSTFESWLISSSNSLALPQSSLSAIMGRATLINGLVATGAGLFSNKLVEGTSSFAAPFVASGMLLLLAWVVIRASWGENYGSGGGGVDADIFQLKRLGLAIRIVRDDPLLLVLGLTQTTFEGSMYLFVFMWVPALQESSSNPSSLPLGFIFSSFMLSMMLGSMLYSLIISLSSSSTSTRKLTAPAEKSDSTLTTHAKLSSLTTALSSLALALCISSPDEKVRFWSFCLFEACVGMYYPVQGTLRGILVGDEHRATLSSLFRVPLNVFVVVSLLTGVSDARHAVFTACAIMLAFSSVMTGAVIVGRVESKDASEASQS